MSWLLKDRKRKYIPAAETDVAKTIKRELARLKAIAEAERESKVTPMRKVAK